MIAKGSNSLKAYVGSTSVSKMYLGDVLVYGGASPDVPESYGIFILNEVELENYYIEANGSLVSYSGYNVSPFYNVEGFEYAGIKESNGLSYVSLYDENKQWICNLESLKNTLYKMPQESKYIRFSARSANFSSTNYCILYNIGDRCARYLIDSIETANSYIDKGTIKSYNGWGISPLYDINYSGVFLPFTGEYSAFYDENGSYKIMANSLPKYSSISPCLKGFKYSNKNSTFGSSNYFLSFETKHADYTLDTIAIPNKYLNGSGAEVSYNGWGISPYYPIIGGAQVIATNKSVGAYCEYYDANKTFLKKFSNNVPQGAAYVRFSFANSGFNGSNAIRIFKYNILN